MCFFSLPLPQCRSDPSGWSKHVTHTPGDCKNSQHQPTSAVPSVPLFGGRGAGSLPEHLRTHHTDCSFPAWMPLSQPCLAFCTQPSFRGALWSLGGASNPPPAQIQQIYLWFSIHATSSHPDISIFLRAALLPRKQSLIQN